MEHHDPSYLQGPYGRLAYRQQDGNGPTLVWLGGYASDMLGSKAEAIADYAAERDQSYLRFDYSGHGESAGRFEDGTISSWFADAEALIDKRVDGPRVMIGSSMGAWITLLHATKHPENLAGIVLIAPAPDFTERLHRPKLTPEQGRILERDGVLKTGTSGHPAETFTRALFVDGRDNLLMDGPIEVPCPVTILHGLDDDVVPTSHVMNLVEVLEAPSVTVTLVKGGDHRLSTDADLLRLRQTLDSVIL